MASGHLILYFRSKLLRWHKNENKRTLPWKGEKDPYRIWLSEIILQQTRAEQGLPYYQKFIETYPNVFALAQATTDEVLKLWQGLGYYSRARNLHATAIKVANEFKGIFPKNFAELKKLKGIGNYTAAAIASFAYGEPVAVVDGNVSRVLSRFFGIEHEINSSEGRKLVDELAQRLVCKKQPGAFNQAAMDLGATICTPRTPSCTACPLKLRCKALKLGKVHLLPVKQQRVGK
ncbi:MAG: A/G-specific adenine glycosylase, partial [Chitinophagales bacterium]|nr:A/G-specific adenine glycosylase [Chitinophagales bacterium]